MSKLSKHERFGGVQRIYGQCASRSLWEKTVFLVGIGGVGSWIAEGLSRSGIGNIFLADLDEVCISNTNRQVPAHEGNFGRAKVDAMAERLFSISPDIKIDQNRVFVSKNSVADLVTKKVDLVVDAGDHQASKASLIAHCVGNQIPIVTIGGAGGLRKVSSIRVSDLSNTRNDALLASVRQTLRNLYRFPRAIGRKFGVTAIFSEEQTLYFHSDGSINHCRPKSNFGGLDCAGSMGSVMHVTSTFANHALEASINILLKEKF